MPISDAVCKIDAMLSATVVTQSNAGQSRPHTLAVGRVDPFAEDSPIKQLEISHFPPDMFFVLRTVQLLRGLAKGMGVDEFSSASQWCVKDREPDFVQQTIHDVTGAPDWRVLRSMHTEGLESGCVLQAAICRGCVEKGRRGRTRQPSSIQVEAVWGRLCNAVAATNIRSASVLSVQSACCECAERV